jgi:regulator of cell morphogenesis and NO signaling
MLLSLSHINPSSLVSDIVKQDYRTAEVFRKYGIEYCCGGKWSLGTATLMKGLELPELIQALEGATQNLRLPNYLPFDKWNIAFLADYIVHVHHYYLKKTLPEIKELLDEFISDHREKYPYLHDLGKIYNQIYRETLPHLKEEEEVIFPYIKQISHAFESHESYAGLLVRTLRKPVEKIMNQEHVMMQRMIARMRELTNNYTAPGDACINHGVALLKLKELDDDLVQHLHLEQDILFPKSLQIEKELLNHEDSRYGT